MIDAADLERKAADLRVQFDHSFALPPEQTTRETHDFLAIRVGGDPYAIRLRDISGIVARRTIVTVPARAPAFVGVAGIRGDIVPVFSLASFLGYGDDQEPPRWMILCGRDQPVGLCFAEFEGYLRLSSLAISANAVANPNKNYVTDVVATAIGARPVIGVSLVITDLRNQRGT